jgi:hypothetical protein
LNPQEIEMPENEIVYLLSNTAMPGIVKIGKTTQADVTQRMNQLYSTGVPVPFDCEYAVAVDDCTQVEKALHIAFEPYRVNPRREFFKIEKDQAIAILKLLALDDVSPSIREQQDSDTEVTKIERDSSKKLRRPPMNYFEMGIPEGSILEYKKDASVSVEVSTPRKVLYQGRTLSLTAITRELLGLRYDVQPTPYWLFEGKSLIDLYDETYTLVEE